MEKTMTNKQRMDEMLILANRIHEIINEMSERKAIIMQKHDKKAA